MQLTTERLLLRDFAPDDWPAVHDYGSRPEACRYQAWGPNSEEDSRAVVQRAIDSAREEPRSRYHLAIELLVERRMIGSVRLAIQSQRFRCGVLAYIVHPELWGQGIATEAARAMLDLGFSGLHLHRIEATCDPRNVASARLLEKLGLRQEGCQREAMLLRDGWRDSLLWGLLEQEWGDGTGA